MSGIDIVALGEPLVEMVQQPSDDAASQIGQRLFQSGVGGDVLNAMVAAARQGARTGLISGVGDDPFGKDIVDFCKSEDIAVDAVRVDPSHPTGLVYIDPDPTERRFHYARRGSAASHVGPDELPADLIAQARVLHLTGVSLAISESMRSAAYRAVDIAKAHGTLVSFDPNYRSKLWTVDVAQRVMEDLLPLVDIVLPSEDEAITLTGLLPVPDILRHYGRHGARVVILKRGALGAVLATGDITVVFPAIPVVAVDSTGAGDSFAGSFLAHYLETDDPVKAARSATEVAAATVTGWGATQAIPRRY